MRFSEFYLTTLISGTLAAVFDTSCTVDHVTVSHFAWQVQSNATKSAALSPSTYPSLSPLLLAQNIANPKLASYDLRAGFA